MNNETHVVEGNLSVPPVKRSRANLIICRNGDAGAMEDGRVDAEYFVDAKEDIVTEMSTDDCAKDATVTLNAFHNEASSTANYRTLDWLFFLWGTWLRLS